MANENSSLQAFLNSKEAPEVIKKAQVNTALQDAGEIYKLGEAADILDNALDTQGRSVEDILKDIQAASNPIYEVDPNSTIQSEEGSILPDPEAQVDIKQSINLVKKHLQKIYGQEIPQFMLDKLTALENGGLKVSTEELEEVMSKAGFHPLEISIAAGITDRNNNIFLKDDSKNRTAVHEIFHAICKNPSELDDNTNPANELVEEALTELWTYLAFSGASLHDPESIYNAIDVDKIKRFTKNVAGSYVSGFRTLIEHILELPETKKSGFAKALPAIFEGYINNNMDVFKTTFGIGDGLNILQKIVDPREIETIPLKIALDSLINGFGRSRNERSDGLMQAFPEYNELFTNFHKALTSDEMIIKFPEALLAENQPIALYEGFEFNADYREEGKPKGQSRKVWVTTSLGLDPLLDIRNKKSLLPSLPAKKAFLLWETIKFNAVRLGFESPQNIDLFNNSLMNKFFGTLSAQDREVTLRSLQKLFKISAPNVAN